MRTKSYGLMLLLFVLLCCRPASAQTPAGRIDFVNARLADVIIALGSSLGVNIVLGAVPEKRITFTTPVAVRAEDLPGVLESILEANNLVLVQKGAVAHVFPADSAPVTGQIRYGTDPGTPPPLGLVTQLVPLASIRADEAAAAIRQIASPHARIEPVARSNALLMTDRGYNIARYLELLRHLDAKPQGEAGLRTYVLPLKYANAEDLATSIAQLFGVSLGGARGSSISDRSLSRSLDLNRVRENETFDLTRSPMSAITNTADTSGGALVGRTMVVPDPPTNSLVIRTAPPNFPLLRETIEALDTRPPQVLFEVTVAEITLGTGLEFGVDWSVVGGTTTVGLGNALSPDSGSSRDFITRLVSLDRANVRAILRALATKSNVRVLSTPEILAVNNREARILVGSRVPFIASTRLGDFAIDRSVQYEDVGATLTIVPTINNDDYVSVQILQEVNSLTNQNVAAALNAPVISTREASTRAIIRDGQTVVIGGLIGDVREYSDSGIPFLKDIPLIGNLFKHRTETRARTELAIFVTPYIIRTDEEAAEIRDRVRARMKEQLPDSIPYLKKRQ